MKILGIGRGLPLQVVTNQQLETILDTSDEWIRSRTGIKERRIMETNNLTALALEAGKEALLDAGLSGQDLDLILVATTLGDYLYPSIACMIQQDLGATCPCIDLHAACPGFLYALDTAEAYIKSGKARHILVVGSEAITRQADWGDRATCVLFGDGAGAFVIGPGDDLLAIHLTARTDKDALYALSPAGNCPYTKQDELQRNGLTMQGQEVFRFAVSQCTQDLQTVADASGIAISDMDYVLLHQANLRIIDTVRRRLSISPERLPCNIHRTGNTSAASIPLLLYELYHSGRLQKGQTLAMAAFGAGLVSAACVLRWDKEPPKALTPADDLFPFLTTN